MILLNGRIITQDRAGGIATAMLVQGDSIVAVGTDDQILQLAPVGDERVDLTGWTVVPGLVDAHLHLQWYAQTLDWVDLLGVNSLGRALALVQARVSATPAGEWVLGRGWNQNLWPDKRFPAAIDLDAVAPDHPVYLIAHSGHASWVNSLALRRAELGAGRADPPGGEIQRDQTGRLTGILLEDAAMNLVQDIIGDPPVAQVADAIRRALPFFWKAGVTGVHCMDRWIAFEALQLLHSNRELGLRVVKYLPLDHLEEAIGLGLRSGDGDEWLRIGGVKLFADGALGVRTALMLAPYEGEPENRGIATLQPEALHHYSRQASGAGLAVAVHAIGDRANRWTLDALEKVPSVAAVPHRIEHVQLIDPQDAGRFAAHNITASMQPVHAPSDMMMADEHWGARSCHAYAFRDLIQSGARLAFGSDAPVEPFDPLIGIHAAVTRRRLDGRPGPEGWYPEQRLTATQALAGFTLGAAQAAGVDHLLGRLISGYKADLVVLDQDILTIDPDAIPLTRVRGTMIGGRWVKPLG
jgi:hypothetical protein